MTSQTPAVTTQGVTPVSAAVMEQVVINGDLDKLSAQDRVAYYKRVCESVGVNPFTRPFQYIRLNGKLTLYGREGLYRAASRPARDQHHRPSGDVRQRGRSVHGGSHCRGQGGPDRLGHGRGAPGE